MKTIYILLLLLLSISCHNSPDFVKAPLRLSAIDSLQTKEEIEQLIGATDTLYKKFKLQRIQDFTTDFFNNEAIKKVAQREKIDFDYAKADFDNNGLTDLLVIGTNKTLTLANNQLNPKVELSKENNTLVLMNFGNANYKLIDISEDKFYFVVPQIMLVNDQPFLKINKPIITNAEGKLLRAASSSQLTYQFGNFVEYNAQPKTYAIEKITFQSQGCPGACPDYTIEITGDRKAQFSAQSNNYSKESGEGTYIEGTFQGTIDENAYHQLTSLLCYLDFPTLKDNYRLVTYHHPKCTLSITYTNGKVKTIKDFGRVGTYGLKRVYALIDELRFNQKWNKQ